MLWGRARSAGGVLSAPFSLTGEPRQLPLGTPSAAIDTAGNALVAWRERLHAFARARSPNGRLGRSRSEPETDVPPERGDQRHGKDRSSLAAGDDLLA